jgi:hypothetical protein
MRNTRLLKKKLWKATAFFYLEFSISCKAIQVIKNPMAATAVYLLSSASMVLPLFLPKNVSAPPAIEPDSPACLPDCSNTITIIDIENNMCKIETAICILKDTS